MMHKRGQISIFVIIALVIVGIIIVFMVYPNIRTLVAPQEISPERYLSDCMQPEVKGVVETLSAQGGYQNPEGYINYLGTNVKYLCYVSGYYKTCLVQQPLLISHFEIELSKILTPKAEACARSMITEYQNRGFSVSYSDIKSNISLSSGKVEITFIAPITITKDETTRTFEEFDAGVNSEIYDLLSIATSIIDFEATYGDSETTLYLRYYPDLKIEKIKLEDGIKIYKLTNSISGEMFQFATRSLVWPPGYGL